MYLDVATMDVSPAELEGLKRARGLYTLFYGENAAKDHIAKSIPKRMWCKRGARVTSVYFYPLMLSESAAPKYEEARSSGLFDMFDVVTPTYDNMAQRGSWIVGRVSCTSWRALIVQVDFF